MNPADLFKTLEAEGVGVSLNLKLEADSKPSDETENTVQDGTNAPDASPDAPQTLDAWSVRGGKQASDEKHRAGRKVDAPDAPKTIKDGPPLLQSGQRRHEPRRPVQNPRG